MNFNINFFSFLGTEDREHGVYDEHGMTTVIFNFYILNHKPYFTVELL